MKVFLGGTCNGSEWRGVLKALLTIDYFDPAVEEWNAQDQLRELEERQQADYLLYVLTARMTGVYSIAEVIDDTHRRPGCVLFCVLEKFEGWLRFTEPMRRSLTAVERMVVRNGGYVFQSLSAIALWLNTQARMQHDDGFPLCGTP